MVGVQKSCATCRRGRVKCDKTRPTCQTCLSQGKECEGYERHSIFVNQTIPDLQARHTSENHSRQYSTRAVLDWSQLSTSIAFNPLVWSPGLDVSLLSMFLALYEPRDPHNRTGPLSIWLRQACGLAAPTELLKLAMYALAAGRLAALDGNGVLARESRVQYGKALRLFSKQLESEQVPTDDQVLAAGRCLLLYELYEPTTQSIQGSISHNRGLNQIVQLRGAQSFKTPFARALLLDLRYANLAHCIQFCTSSLFVDDQWRLPGPPRSLHDVEHSSIHIGCDIAPLICQRNFPMPDAQASMFTAPDEALLTLLEQDQRSDELLAYANRLNPGRPNEAASEAHFWDLESAIVVGNILCLKLCISYSIRHHASKLQTLSLDAAANRFMAECVPKYTGDNEEAIARQALDALTHAASPGTGLYGGQRALLGVRLIVMMLPSESRVYKAASELSRGLIKERHLQHAKDLSQVWGDVE